MRLPVCFLFAGLFVACAGEEPRTSVTEADSAGITIVESASPRWGETEAWSVDPEPFLDLTTSGTGDAHWFFRVTDATRLPDGSITVAENNSDEIRFFSAEGTFLKGVGKEGEGPGEFRWPSSIDRYRGDSLVVFDPRLGRVTVLDPQWEVSRVIPVRLSGAQVRHLHPLSPDHTNFIARASLLYVPEERDGFHRKPEALIRLSAAGGVIDTLAILAGYEDFQWQSGGISAVSLFVRNSYSALHLGRIYLGDADEMEIKVYSALGQVERIIRVPTFDLTLSAQEIREEREARLELNPSAMNRELLSAMPDPETRPAYSDLVIDSEGFIWVEESQGRTLKFLGGQPSRWTVFSPEGEWLGGVQLPSRFFVFEIGSDYVLGRRYDEQDVEHVEFLRLTRE